MSGKTIPVIDYGALTEVLKSLAETHGSQTEAARALGLSDSDYSRLLRGKRSAIRVETFEKILGSLRGPEGIDGTIPAPVFDGPLPFWVGRQRNDATLQVRRERSGATEEEVEASFQEEALQRYRLWDAFRRAFVSDDTRFVWSTWYHWLKAQTERMRPSVHPIVDTLWQKAEAKQLIQQFLRKTGRDATRLPDDDDLRCWLALYRAVEPLAASEPTWGVEPGVPELSGQDQLASFLGRRLDLEALLYEPAHDLLRVMQGAAPISFGDWLGKQELEEGDD